jgi:hypothetical protein
MGDIRERYAFLVECVRYSNARREFWLECLLLQKAAHTVKLLLP